MSEKQKQVLEQLDDAISAVPAEAAERILAFAEGAAYMAKKQTDGDKPEKD